MESVDYLKLFNNIMQHLIVVLGKDASVGKARQIKGLSISDDGKVLKIEGNPVILLQEFVAEFTALAGKIITRVIMPLLVDYPHLSDMVAHPEKYKTQDNKNSTSIHPQTPQKPESNVTQNTAPLQNPPKQPSQNMPELPKTQAPQSPQQPPPQPQK